MSRDQPLRQPERGSVLPKRLDSDTEATRVFRPNRDSQEVIAAGAPLEELQAVDESMLEDLPLVEGARRQDLQVVAETRLKDLQVVDETRLEDLQVVDETIEELGDEAIVGQASPAHEPRPGLEVSMELRRVVISSPPSVTNNAAPTAENGRPVRERRISEPTLVIRDRRQLQDLQRQLLAEQALLGRSRSVWMWGALAILGAVLIGMLLVLAARRERSSLPSISDDTEMVGAPANAAAHPGASELPRPAASGKAGGSRNTVDLSDLPVER